jgi:hypothetical protein
MGIDLEQEQRFWERFAADSNSARNTPTQQEKTIAGLRQMSDWLPTRLMDERLNVHEAQHYVKRLQRALGNEWRVSLFPLQGGGRMYLGNLKGLATVEIRRARPPMVPPVVLRTAAVCEAYLAAWVAAHSADGEHGPALPPKAGQHALAYAGVTPRERR